MTARRMFRYEMPIDDEPHGFALSASPVAVATTPPHEMTVEFWAEHEDGVTELRLFQVFGTGHLLPDGARWIGTCPRTQDDLVWHLYEVTS